MNRVVNAREVRRALERRSMESSAPARQACEKRGRKLQLEDLRCCSNAINTAASRRPGRIGLKGRMQIYYMISTSFSALEQCHPIVCSVHQLSFCCDYSTKQFAIQNTSSCQ